MLSLYFTRKGYNGVSISELGKASNLAKASVMHHFSTKQKIYSAALDRIDISLEKLVDHIMSDDVDTRNRIEDMISATSTVDY